MTRSANSSRPAEALPYRIELWHPESHEIIERVLARAVTAQLARAIFQAARDEHPQRRITLRKGNRILSDTSGNDHAV
ncbi:hypothetical protein [Mesorhizobium sp. B1-1-8]|uniref:hypothetical protein n=1 Tax=Mesorhizobium sp. B1-1-8 TaxID=2589976 RepID=UPI00112DD9BB|nr:hypothetical protein [Mesorhizobium sp. B1-1-8]UCI08638.1 hypothetical protein FJ974_06095 [Mesorhizobium sp. B1-1-8]